MEKNKPNYTPPFCAVKVTQLGFLRMAETSYFPRRCLKTFAQTLQRKSAIGDRDVLEKSSQSVCNNKSTKSFDENSSTQAAVEKCLVVGSCASSSSSHLFGEQFFVISYSYHPSVFVIIDGGRTRSRFSEHFYPLYPSI